MSDQVSMDSGSLQDHLDELMLLGQQADQRLDRLQDVIETYQGVNKQLAAEVFEKITGVEDHLIKLDSVAGDIERSSERTTRQAVQGAYLFLGSTVVGLLIVLGAWWWSDHLLGKLSHARAELASLTVKLAHKPIIRMVNGQPFVRVMPNSQTSLRRRDNQFRPGVYARVWFNQ